MSEKNVYPNRGSEMPQFTFTPSDGGPTMSGTAKIPEWSFPPREPLRPNQFSETGSVEWSIDLRGFTVYTVTVTTSAVQPNAKDTAQ